MNLDEKELIKSVEKAEQNTLGEILPVIVQESDFYPGSFWRSSLFFSLLSMAFSLWVFEWGSYEVFSSALLGSIIGYFLCYLAPLKRLFLNKNEMNEEVRQLVFENFFFYKVHETQNHSGIMLMISLLERRVELMADKGINDRVEEGTWDHILEELTKKIKRGQIQEGLKKAIESCGEILKEKFPCEGENPNELKNRVIVITN